MVVDRSSSRSLRIYVIGDFGSGDRWQAKVADAMALLARREPPDFLLSTGDCLYLLEEDGTQLSAAARQTILSERFDPYYARLGVDFYQCLGNHDALDVFGGNIDLMIAHSHRSAVWRLPAQSYRVPRLPPWIAIHVANTNVFGYGDHVAEGAFFSPERMDYEMRAISESFANHPGLKLLVGHHPVFTPGKRTYRYGGDGEVLYMRPLRHLIENLGVHFYLSGHEHHQSHTTGASCEFVIQGCGGAGRTPNPKHARRPDGWSDAEKVFRYCAVKNGFAVLEADASLSVRLRFLAIDVDAPADTVHVIYERRWSGGSGFGLGSLRCAPATDSAMR